MSRHVLTLCGLMATGDFEAFLGRVVMMFPTESKLILGEADVSPESATAARHADALAYQIFPAEDIVDHREFERAALGLRHFWDVLTGNRANMPHISDDRFAHLQRWLDVVIVTEEELLTAIWAILFNDLGKLKWAQAQYTALKGAPHADHDVVLGTLLREAPELFPGLNAHQRDVLVPGFVSGFNLGQAVQLECPEASWQGFVAMDDVSRKAFLVHAVFDFFGLTGAVDPARASEIFVNNNNVDAYLKVAETPDYTAYVLWRAALVGGDSVAAGVLAGLFRFFTPQDGALMEEGCAQLKPILWFFLLHELKRMSGSAPAILPYYAPAMLAYACKVKPGPEGVALGLNILGVVLLRVREKGYLETMPAGTVWIANLHALATMLAKGEIPDIHTLTFQRVEGGVMVFANAVTV